MEIMKITTTDLHHLNRSVVIDPDLRQDGDIDMYITVHIKIFELNK